MLPRAIQENSDSQGGERSHGATTVLIRVQQGNAPGQLDLSKLMLQANLSRLRACFSGVPRPFSSTANYRSGLEIFRLHVPSHRRLPRS